jgi:acetoin utilization deacetylase AcuC-like enzyme
MDHFPGNKHPEQPDRLEAVLAGFENSHIKESVTELVAEPVEENEIFKVHEQRMVHHLKEVHADGGGRVDEDTKMSQGSWLAARLAAGAGLQAIKYLREGDGEAAFCAVRPPGHHATPVQSMGFCLLNNVALAAKHLLSLGEKVLIVDYDAHHGNGTQDVFYSEPNVLFISFHQWPLYPGTGAMGEIGEGEGEGTTLNIPLPAGATGDIYLQAWDEIALPVVERFSPTWVLVSAGFDAHRLDPITDLGLTSGDYNLITSRIIETVPIGHRLVFLEGGYDLKALELSTTAVLHALTGETIFPEPVSNGGPGQETISQIKKSVQEK